MRLLIEMCAIVLTDGCDLIDAVSSALCAANEGFWALANVVSECTGDVDFLVLLRVKSHVLQSACRIGSGMRTKCRILDGEIV